MVSLTLLVFSVLSTTSVSIVEPIDGETYDGDWLPFRVIVENENEVPDSVHYSLNGATVVQIPRLNTDWPTYMQNYQNTGYSESPAPYTNEVLWAAPVTGFVHEFPTPVVYEGIVYYAQNLGGEDLYALDCATGEIIWIYEGTGITDDAVTVADGRVYSPSDSTYCLDAYTGEEIWVSPMSCSGGGSFIVTDDKVFCVEHEWPDVPHVHCLSALDGSVIWTQDIENGVASCVGMWENILIVPTNSPNIALYGIDTETGEILWGNTDIPISFHDSSPTVSDGIIYINGINEYTYAIDAYTGEILWQQATGGGTATIAYHDDKLYFATESTPYYCLDALSGSTIWISPYEQHGSSAVADGLVFFGESISEDDSSRVIALDCLTGQEIWSYTAFAGDTTIADGFQGSPSVVDGVMYYPCTDGNLYAFGTGLKYTYREDFFYSDIGSNELIVTSWDGGIAVAADTISFTVTQTGITLEPSSQMNLHSSPNPIRNSTSISFELEKSGFTSVRIFDLSGREVSTLVDQECSVGSHSFQWNGCTDEGQHLSSGLYLCRIETEGVVETTGLCVLR